MKNAERFAIAFVTAPDMTTARRLTRAALKARLVACVNLIPRIESHYWWSGRLDSGTEVLLLMKTERRRLRALEKLVLEEHPYDTPEFIACELAAGNERYLAWITDSLSGT